MSALSVKGGQRVVRPRFELKVRSPRVWTVLWHELQTPREPFTSVLYGRLPSPDS